MISTIYKTALHCKNIGVRLAIVLLLGAFFIYGQESALGSEESSTIIPKEAWIGDFDVKETLARLYKSIPGNFDKAIAMYRKLLDQKPHDPVILMELIEIYIYQKKFEMALSLLQNVSPLENDLKQQLKMAQLESLLGYASKSRTRFRFILSKDPHLSGLTLAYATALMSWGSFYEAEKIYTTQVPSDEEERLALLLGSIDVLIATDRLLEADQYIEELLGKYPAWKEKLLTRLALSKRLQNENCTVLKILDQLLLIAPEKGIYLLEKASLLYRLKAFEEMLEVSSSLANSPGYEEEAMLQIGKACNSIGRGEEAFLCFQEAMQSGSTFIPASYYFAAGSASECWFIRWVIDNAKTAQELLEWANLYGEAGNAPAMLQLLLRATEIDPAHFPSQMELAETYSTLLQHRCAAEIYSRLQEEMGNNCKLLLSLARVTSWDKNYNESLNLYSLLTEWNPQDPIPLLEMARVAFWGKNYPLSMILYQNALSTAFAGWDERGCPILSRREKAISLEIAARRAEWANRQFKEAAIGKELHEEEPGDSNWKFDYAQSLCSLGLCRQAASLYSSILNDVPLHTVAKLALLRNRQKLHPTLGLSSLFWHEVGYGELAQIGRYGEVFAAQFPFSCEHSLTISQVFWDEHTFYDHHYHPAHGAAALWHYQLSPQLTINNGAQYKNYGGHFSNTFNYFTEIQIQPTDCLKLTFGFKKSDLIFNYFNLAQKTQGYISSAAFNLQPTHSLWIEPIFENTVYSDKNNMQRALINVKYAITEYPKAFSLILTGEFRNTAHTNIFIYNSEGMLVNIIHPYWAPQHYFLGQLLLSFRHDYGVLTFCEAPERYYQLSTSAGMDTQDNPYCAFEAKWVHELFYHWKATASCYIHRSNMWNAKGFWFSLAYTF